MSRGLFATAISAKGRCEAEQEGESESERQGKKSGGKYWSKIARPSPSVLPCPRARPRYPSTLRRPHQPMGRPREEPLPPKILRERSCRARLCRSSLSQRRLRRPITNVAFLGWLWPPYSRSLYDSKPTNIRGYIGQFQPPCFYPQRKSQSVTGSSPRFRKFPSGPGSKIGASVLLARSVLHCSQNRSRRERMSQKFGFEVPSGREAGWQICTTGMPRVSL